MVRVRDRGKAWGQRLVTPRSMTERPQRQQEYVSVSCNTQKLLPGRHASSSGDMCWSLAVVGDGS